MSTVFGRLSWLLAICVLAATLLVACGGSTNSGARTKHAPPSPPDASITIPAGQELFAPFILTVQAHTTVTWQNNDRVAHTIMTTWNHTTFLNPEIFSLSALAGQKATFTFSKPGVYDYFDDTQATWSTTDQRVTANKGVPNFPLAMEGIIWVQGSVSGLPHAADNGIPNGKDDFRTDFLAVTLGGKVTWQNSDTDTHFISAVAGWAAPINATNLGVIQIQGTHDAPPRGGSTTFTFNVPGLYYYYCAAHASMNTAWHRIQAHQDASEYPIPMEGFILVVGS